MIIYINLDLLFESDIVIAAKYATNRSRINDRTNENFIIISILKIYIIKIRLKANNNQLSFK